MTSLIGNIRLRPHVAAVEWDINSLHPSSTVIATWLALGLLPLDEEVEIRRLLKISNTTVPLL